MTLFAALFNAGASAFNFAVYAAEKGKLNLFFAILCGFLAVFNAIWWAAR